MTDQRHWCAAIGAGSATTVVKRALRLLAAVLAGVAAALPLLAPQSAAAISGLQRVSSYSGYDDRPWKAATAGCPANKHVIGGGAWVSELTLASTPGGNAESAELVASIAISRP